MPDRELSKEQKAVFRTERAAKDLLATPGWQFYEKVLREQLEMKRREYERPAELEPGMDGVSQILRAESAKGAIMGLRLALDIPQGMLVAGHNLRVSLGLESTAGEDE